jgi:hypothetical protein
LVVVAFAQRLPVCFVPKELLVPAVRDDVVNHSRWRDATLFLAFHA